MAKTKVPKPMREWLADDKSLMSHVHIEPEEQYLSLAVRGKTDDYCGAGSTMTLADCDRKVRIDLSVWGNTKKTWENNRKAAYKKIERLRKALDYAEELLGKAEFVEKSKDYL